jgi:hypothetical protein
LERGATVSLCLLLCRFSRGCGKRLADFIDLAFVTASLVFVLGSERKIFPELVENKPVTLSEIASKCLELRNKNWLHFTDQLRRFGYCVEKGIIFSDSEVKEILRIIGDFLKFYSNRGNCVGSDEFLNAYLEFFDSLCLTGKQEAKHPWPSFL